MIVLIHRYLIAGAGDVPVIGGFGKKPRVYHDNHDGQEKMESYSH
jgi:hypothetical protein